MLIEHEIKDIWTERRSSMEYKRGARDHRSPFDRDRTRVIHCPAFRRLQRKTQILGTHCGDFHRTRLTHSLEVASIGRSLVRNLRMYTSRAEVASFLPCDDLISAICLLHDIGHPPFGHGGEAALNYMMRSHGGFEGNAQTLRLLTKLEDTYGAFGLDLTRRTLLGILKYPVERSAIESLGENQLTKPFKSADWTAPKAYYTSESSIVDWILSPLTASEREIFKSPQPIYHSLDCGLMDIADDIAYGVHDLEDAIHLSLIKREQFDIPLLSELLGDTPFNKQKSSIVSLLFSENMAECKAVVGELVNYFITAADFSIAHEAFQVPLLRYEVRLPSNARKLLDYFKAIVYQHVIDSQAARVAEHGGQMIVIRLFEALSSSPEGLLDLKHRALYLQAEDKSQALRVICDYIANMSDDMAWQWHERLFGAIKIT